MDKEEAKKLKAQLDQHISELIKVSRLLEDAGYEIQAYMPEFMEGYFLEFDDEYPEGRTRVFKTVQEVL